jgi:hypothetical protein
MSPKVLSPIAASDASINPAREPSSALFSKLRSEGLLALGVPVKLGGIGGQRQDVVQAVHRLAQVAPKAAAVLASHHGVLGALLAGRNLALRQRWVPALARGAFAGVWPGSAIEDMLQRGRAAVQRQGDAPGSGWYGPLGRLISIDPVPMLLAGPVQSSIEAPPQLALLIGNCPGLRWHTLPPSASADRDLQLVSADSLPPCTRDVVDLDAARIAMAPEIQPLHAAVLHWLALNRQAHHESEP